MVTLSASSPVTFQDPLPDAVDVVVIGAGVIGIATAWFLTSNGLSVLVCEKGRVAGEQSSRNWGWIRQQRRDHAELPIVMESIKLWQALAQEVDEDIGFTQQGVIYLAETEAELARYEQWLEVAKQQQLDTRILTRKQVDELITDNPGQWCGALYTPSDARAEPFKAVPALARALQKRGCRIREGCAVRIVDSAAGAVCGVITEHGRVKAQAVVLAAGAWSSAFARNAGVAVPQLTVRSTAARTAPAPDVFAGNALCHDVAFRRRMDGGYTVALGDYAEHLVGPDSFRHLFGFLPSLRRSWHETTLRFGDGIVRRFAEAARWDGDDVTPFETNRGAQSGAVSVGARANAQTPGTAPAGDGEHRVRGAMGGDDRRHARCRARDGRRRPTPRFVYRYRLQRPWFRHRAGRRTGHGGYDSRPRAELRSHSLPFIALFRRQPARAGTGALAHLYMRNKVANKAAPAMQMHTAKTVPRRLRCALRACSSSIMDCMSRAPS